MTGRSNTLLLLSSAAALLFTLAHTLIITFPPGGSHAFAKPVLLPIQLPWIPQDPQGVPRGVSRAFGFEPGGSLEIHIVLADRSSAALTDDDSSSLPPDDDEEDGGGAVKSSLGALASSPRLASLLPAWWPNSGREADVKAALRSFAAAELAPVPATDESADEIATDPRAVAYLLLLNADQWDSWLDTLVQAQQGLLPPSLDSYVRSELRVPLYDGLPLDLNWRAAREGMYSLVIVNPKRRVLVMEGNVTMINGAGLRHLSTTMQRQALALTVAHLLYLVAAVVIAIWLVLHRFRGVEVASLAAACLLLKAGYLILDARNFEAFRVRGGLSPVEWVLPRTLANFQSISLLALFLLVAFGWRIHRSQLSLLELRLLGCVCLLSLYLGVFEVSMGAFQAIRYIIHSLVYLVVLVAVNFDVVLLGSMLGDMGLTMGTAELYQKREAYLCFRTNFVLYVLKPTIDLFYKITVLPGVDTEDWTILTVDNVIDLFILVSIVYVFRPEIEFPLLKDLQEQQPPLPLPSES